MEWQTPMVSTFCHLRIPPSSWTWVRQAGTSGNALWLRHGRVISMLDLWTRMSIQPSWMDMKWFAQKQVCRLRAHSNFTFYAPCKSHATSTQFEARGLEDSRQETAFQMSCPSAFHFFYLFTSDLSFIKFPKAEPAPMRPVSSTMCKWSSWYWSHPWNWRNGNLVVTFVKIQRQTTAFDILCVLQQLVKPWGFHGFPHGCHAQPRPAATDLPAAGRCSMYIPGSVVRDCISRASK